MVRNELPIIYVPGNNIIINVKRHKFSKIHLMFYFK